MNTECAVKLILILLFTIQLNHLQGQDCSKVKRTRTKNNVTETIGEIVQSKDFYTLAFEKTTHKVDKSKAPAYSLELMAASKVIFTDSMLNTKGTFELILRDNSVLTIYDVTYKNNPLGYCCAVEFAANIGEDIVRKVSNSPIVTIRIIEAPLSTSFTEKRQREMQAICGCLLIK